MLHGVGNQQRIDFVLGEQLLTGAFTDVHENGVTRNHQKNFGADQRIVKDHVRRGEQAHGSHREEVWITRTGANEKDLAHQTTPCVEESAHVSLRKRSNISRLANWCSRAFFSSPLPAPERMSSRAVPSQSSHRAYSSPYCCSRSFRMRCASEGLLPLVDTAICRSPRCTTAP